jgi:PAS domain S-box-containing protein
METYGVKLDVVLALALAGLAAVNLAVFLVIGFDLSSLFTSLVLALSMVLASQALASARDERTEADYWRGQADSYRRMLNDYFLVSKVDASGRFCEANENLLRRTGYSLEELASQPLGGLSSGVLSNEYLSAMWSTVQSGKTWSGEFCDRAKDGSYVWVRAIVIPWSNARGELECLTTIGVDVTEQRKAEFELKQAHARLEAFIKHAPAAVAMFDTNMRYVAHTDRWLQDYHLDLGSLVGLCHYDVFPEIPQHWKAKHQRILAGATESCEEERFRRSDGSENILRWEVRPWRMPDNSIGGIIMLTERSRSARSSRTSSGAWQSSTALQVCPTGFCSTRRCAMRSSRRRRAAAASASL